jgi:hypothetical protein
MLRRHDLGGDQTIGKVLTPAGEVWSPSGILHRATRQRDLRLGPRQAYIVPKGRLHRPVVPVRTAVLMLEQAGAVATGD